MVIPNAFILTKQFLKKNSCKTNEPSILLSMGGGGGKFKGENVSLKQEVGAGLNS
jgi:hypothetical protein